MMHQNIRHRCVAGNNILIIFAEVEKVFQEQGAVKAPLLDGVPYEMLLLVLAVQWMIASMLFSTFYGIVG